MLLFKNVQNKFKTSNRKVLQDYYKLSCLGLKVREELLSKTIACELKKRKIYKTVEEYEEALNELAEYIFEDDRKVVFHRFRGFPYVCHGLYDGKGTMGSYTMADIVFTRLILDEQVLNGDTVEGIDVVIFKNLTRKIGKVADIPIAEIPADFLLKVR